MNDNNYNHKKCSRQTFNIWETSHRCPRPFIYNILKFVHIYDRKHNRAQSVPECLLNYYCVQIRITFTCDWRGSEHLNQIFVNCLLTLRGVCTEPMCMFAESDNCLKHTRNSDIRKINKHKILCKQTSNISVNGRNYCFCVAFLLIIAISCTFAICHLTLYWFNATGWCTGKILISING